MARATVTIDEMKKWPVTVGIEEARLALGVSRSLAYSLASADKFPCRVLKLGRTYRIVTASLIGVIEGTEAPAQPVGESTPRPPHATNSIAGQDPTHIPTRPTLSPKPRSPAADPAIPDGYKVVYGTRPASVSLVRL